jgi:hypothetical protein
LFRACQKARKKSVTEVELECGSEAPAFTEPTPAQNGWIELGSVAAVARGGRICEATSELLRDLFALEEKRPPQKAAATNESLDVNFNRGQSQLPGLHRGFEGRDNRFIKF